MAKPRIFLSSTCYDLGDARSSLTEFFEGLGFEVLNSQNNSFGVLPKAHSHDACIAMMKNADYVILIIGGRRGGTYVGSEQSITNEEIRAAQKLERPIFAFLDKKVDALRQVYRKNPTANFAPAVNDVRVFDFIDFVASGHEDNWLHLFDDVTDIQEGMLAQFAYILLLYSQSLRTKDTTAEPVRNQIVSFPATLDGLPGDTEDERTLTRSGLRQVYDSLKRLLDADTKPGVKQEQMKSIWVIARHGLADDRTLRMKEDRFKASAWGVSRGKRVFGQMPDCGIEGNFDYEEDHNGQPYGTVEITFSKSEAMPAEALKIWVDELVARYGPNDAMEMFNRLDLRPFSKSTEPQKKSVQKKLASKKKSSKGTS
tara:strand:+ start:3715 stop:4824 length:1110 start_codon:yes stop_codon:yes gene_type:complete